MNLIKKIFLFLMFTISSFAMDDKKQSADNVKGNNYNLGTIFEILSRLYVNSLNNERSNDLGLIILTYIDNSEDFLAKIKAIQKQNFKQLYDLNHELNSKYLSLVKLHELDNNYSSDVKFLVSDFNRDRLVFYFKNGMLFCALNSNVNSKLLGDSKGAVNVVSFSPDGKYIVSGLANNHLKLYDLTNNTEKNIGSRIYHNEINSIEFYPDRGRFVTSCKDKVCFWNISDLSRPEDTISSRVIDYIYWDNINFIKIVTNTIILVNTNKGVYFLDNSYRSWFGTLLLVDDSKTIDFALKRRFLVTVEDNSAKIYESNLSITFSDRPKILKNIESSGNSSINLAVISPCANFLVIACADGIAKFFDLSNLKNIQEISQMQAHSDSICSAKFNTDGSYLITGSRDCTLKLWSVGDFKTPLLVKTFNENDNAIFSVDFSPDYAKATSGRPDNKYIVAGTWANGTRLWDIGSANILDDTSTLQLADMDMFQLGFIIKFFNNFSEKDIESPIFKTLDDKVKKYLNRITELRKALPDTEGFRNNIDFILEYLGKINNKKAQKSSGCVIS